MQIIPQCVRVQATTRLTAPRNRKPSFASQAAAIGGSGPSEPIKKTAEVPARQRSAAWRRTEARVAFERLMDRCVRDARL